MKKVMNVMFCNNNKVTSKDFNLFGDWDPSAKTFQGFPIVKTIEEARQYGTAFVGWIEDGESVYTDNVLGLYDRGIFVLYWAVGEYLTQGRTWWVENYVLDSEDMMERVKLVAHNYQAEYFRPGKYGPARPGYCNWAELSFALRHGYYYAPYRDGWPEYHINECALSVVEDITFPENQATRRLAKAYAVLHDVTFEEAFDDLAEKWNHMYESKLK